MSLLSRPTKLGNLQLIEVYEYYDQPVLFTCRNAVGTLLIVVLVDETDDDEVWLCAPISEKRFQSIRSGGIDLHDAFAQTEDGSVYEVHLPFEDDQTAQVDMRLCETLPDEWLPTKGASLDLEPVLKDDLSTEAQQTKRQRLDMAFEFPNTLKTEAPAKRLGDILSALQEMLYAIGNKLVNAEASHVGRMSDEVLGRMELSVLDVAAGSFKVKLASVETLNLFGDSDVGNAIEKFLDLLSLESDTDALQAELKALEARVATKYLAFLKTLGKEISSTRFTWASPVPDKGGQAYLSRDKVEAIIDVIEIPDELPPKEYDIIGDLIGANIRSKQFEIWISRNEGKYVGKIADEALDAVKTATISQRYAARIKEFAKFKPMIDDYDIRYELIDLKPYPPPHLRGDDFPPRR